MSFIRLLGGEVLGTSLFLGAAEGGAHLLSLAVLLSLMRQVPKPAS